jgi:ribosome-associated protein
MPTRTGKQSGVQPDSLAGVQQDGQLDQDGGRRLNPTELAHKIVDLVEDKQAEDIVLLDLRSISVIADYFVICTATTERQTKAVVEAVSKELKQDGILAAHVEGQASGGWMLIDFSDVIVHVFGPTQRDYYQLEELWQNAPVVVKIQ